MTLVLFLAVVLLAFVTEAVVGFGSTVLVVTLGAHLYPLDTLLAAFVPVNLLLSLYLVARHHGGIDRRVLFRRVLPFVGLGLPLGMVAFQLRDATLLQTGFAAFVVLIAGLELGRVAFARTDAAPRPLALPATAGVLFAGGIIHGIYGSGGPMIVYYASRALPDKRAFRSTLSALWLILNAVLVTGYAASGVLTPESGRLSLWLLPALVAGLWAGERIHGRVKPRPFRISVFALLFLAGCALLARSL